MTVTSVDIIERVFVREDVPDVIEVSSLFAVYPPDTASNTAYDPTGNTVITAGDVQAALDQADAALVATPKTLSGLYDVNIPGPLAQDNVLAWNTGTARWTPIDIATQVELNLLPNTYVTLATAQTISGAKTFSHANGIVVGAMQLWDTGSGFRFTRSTVNSIYIDSGGNVGLTGRVGVGSGSPQNAALHVVNVGGAAQPAIRALAAAAQTANIQEWQDSVGTILARVTNIGAIQSVQRLTAMVGASAETRVGDIGPSGQSGIDFGSAHDISIFRNNAGQLTISGNDPILTISDNDPTTRLAQITLGTQGGSWNIYNNNNLNFDFGFPRLVLGRLASDVGAAIRGAAAQTADLTQWQDPTGTVVASVDAFGTIFNSVAKGAVTTRLLRLTSPPTTGVNADMNLDMLVGKSLVFNGSSSGTGFTFQSGSTGIALIAKGAASQTVDLQQWQDSGGTVLGFIKPTGFAGFGIATQGAASLSGQPGVEAVNAVRAIRPNVPSQFIELEGFPSSSGGLTLHASASNKPMSIRNTSVAGANTAGYGIIFELDDTAAGGGVKQTAGINSQGIFWAGASGGGVLGTLGVTGFLVNTPQTLDVLANVQITARALGHKPLVVQAFAGQTANIQEWQRSDGTVSAALEPPATASGVVLAGDPILRFSNTDGYIARIGIGRVGGNGRLLILNNTGGTRGWLESAGINTDAIRNNGNYQVATVTNGGLDLDGQYVGTVPLTVRPNAGYVGVAVRAAASQTGDLEQWQNNAGAAMASVNATGEFWGSSNIRLTTGTSVYWGASGSFGDRITAVSATDMRFFVNGTEVIRLGNAGTLIPPGASAGASPLKVRGVTGQTGNLQEWQDASPAVLAYISASGMFRSSVAGIGISTSGVTKVNFDYPGVGGAFAWDPTLTVGPSLLLKAGAASVVPFAVRGAAAQTGNLTEWQDSTGALLARLDAAANLGTLGYVAIKAAAGPAIPGDAALRVGGVNFAGAPVIVARDAVGQTANIQEWQNSSGSAISAVAAGGELQLLGTGNGGTGAGLSMGYAAGSYGWIQSYSSVPLWLNRIGNDVNVGGNIVLVNNKALKINDTGGTARNIVTIASDTNSYWGYAGQNSYWTQNIMDVTAMMTIHPTATGNVPLVVKGLASQTADLTQWQNSAGFSVARIAALGDGVFKNVTTRLIADDGITAIGGVGVISGSTNTGFFGWYLPTGTRIGYMGFSTTDIPLNLENGTRFVVNASALDKTPLVVKGFAGHTAPLQELQNSAGTTQLAIMPNGDIRWPVGNNPTIGLNGANPYISTQGVTVFDSNGGSTAIGNGVPSFPRGALFTSLAAAYPAQVIRGFASQTADLTQWQQSDGTVAARITAAGTALNFSYATVSSVGHSGTGAHLMMSNASNRTWLPQSRVYVGSNAATDAYSLGVYGTNASDVVSAFRGVASQSGDLAQWQNSSGTVLTRIDNGGWLHTPNSYVGSPTFDGNLLLDGTSGGGGPYLYFQQASSNKWLMYQAGGSSLYVRDMVNGRMSMQFGSGLPGQAFTNVYDALTAQSNAKALTPTLRSVTSNVATLDLGASHGVVAGHAITVSGNGAPFDGTFQVIGSAATTISYMVVSADIAQVAAAGSVVADVHNTNNRFQTLDARGNVLFSVAPSGGVTLNGYPTTAGRVEENSGTLAFVSHRWNTTADAGESFRIRAQRIGGAGGALAHNLWFTDNVDNVIVALAGDGSRNVGVGGKFFPQGNVSYGQFSVQPTSASRVAALIQGTTSQTGDLQQWQDSAGVVLASVDATGRFPSFGNSGTTTAAYVTMGGRARFGWSGSNEVDIDDNGTNKTIRISTSGSPRLTIANGSAAIPGSINIGALWSVGVSYAALALQSPVATGIGQIVRGAASQTANLQEWQDSTGAILSRVGSGGEMVAPYFSATGASGIVTSVIQSAASGVYMSVAAAGWSLNNTTTVANVPLSVRGMAAQTGDLQQWKDSAGTVLARFDNNAKLWLDNGSGWHIRHSTETGSTLRGLQAAVGIFSGLHDITGWNNSGGGTRLLTSNTGGGANRNAVVTLLTGISGGQASFEVGFNFQNQPNTLTNQRFYLHSDGTSILRGGGLVATVVTKEITANVATLTTSTVHGFTAGKRVRVTGVGAPFDGTYTITSTPTTTTFTYALVNADIVPTAAVGFAYADLGNTDALSILNGASETLAKINAAGSLSFMSGQSLFFFRPDGVTQGMNMSSGTANNFLSASNGSLVISAGAFATQVVAGTAASKALIVQGAAAQSSNLQEWQNSAGTVLASLGASGNLVLATGSGNALTVNGQPVQFDAPGLGAAFSWSAGQLLLKAKDTGTVPLVSRGIASQTADLQQWQDSTGTKIAFVAANGEMWAASGFYVGAGITTSYALHPTASPGTRLQASGAAIMPLVVKGAASQTANLQQWQDSAGTVLSRVLPGGGFSALLSEGYGFNGNNAPSGGMWVSANSLVLRSAAASATVLLQDSAGTTYLTAAPTALTIPEASNIVLGTATGTKIGTTNLQKMGFWNATPVVQQTLPAAGVVTAADIRSLLITIGLAN